MSEHEGNPFAGVWHGCLLTVAIVAGLAALVMLCSCAPVGQDVTPLSASEMRYAETALAAWNADPALPRLTWGGCLARLQAGRLDEASYAAVCGVPAGIGHGCLRWPVYVFDPLAGDEPGVMVHAALHVLVACARVSADVFDRRHELKTVWWSAGRADSAQGRALRALEP